MRAWTRAVDGMLVTEARFPPGAVLDRHRHERPIVCVMLEGSFDHVGDRGAYDCTPGTLLVEPAEEPHGNRIQRAGAHVLVIQPEPRSDLTSALGGLLDRSVYLREPGVVSRARALAREMSARDDVAPLALEAGALDLLAVAARVTGLRRGDTPAWLARARERIEDGFREPLRLAELAREASVHPAHLSRVFRQRYREPVAGCIRRLRTEWGAERLAATDEPISTIALAAGFADQSHFTRALRAATGMTPAVYRRERRRERRRRATHPRRVAARSPQLVAGRCRRFRRLLNRWRRVGNIRLRSAPKLWQLEMTLPIGNRVEARFTTLSIHGVTRANQRESDLDSIARGS